MEGRAFKDIDLSHPELQQVAKDMLTLQRNFEDLTKLGRGSTAAAVRNGRFNDALDWYEHHDRMFPETGARQRHSVNAGRYLLHGTRYAPSERDREREAREEQRQQKATTPLSGALAFGQAAVPWMLAMAGVQKVAGMISQGVGQAQDEAVNNDVLMRTLRDGTTDFERLRDSVRATTEGLQLTYGEAQRLSLAWTRLTNESNSDRLRDNVRFAAGLARGYGLDPGSMVQGLGRASFVGEDPRRFALILGEAVREGGMGGQVEQTMQALLRWSEGASRTLVTHSNMAEFAAMYAGLNATGQPGLKGANAEHLITQINSAVTQGGAAGDASMALTSRALARRGITDPYQVENLLEGGMFASPASEGMGTDTASLFEIMRGEINRMYAGQPEYRRLHALARHFGINQHQARALESFHYADIGRTQTYLNRAGINMQELNPTALADIGNVMGSDDLEGWRRKLLGRSDLSGDTRKALSITQGEELREELVKALGQSGMEKTEGTRVSESMSALSNALTASGTGLLPVVNDLKMVVSRFGDEVGKLSMLLGDLYKGTVRGEGGAAEHFDNLLNGPRAIGRSGEGDFMSALAQIESSGGANTVNSRSSARGMFQFTSGTWLSTVRRFGGPRVSGMSDEDLLKLRDDPDFSRQMGIAHLYNDIDPALRHANVPVSNVGRYAGWHFGEAGGAAVMSAPSDKPMSDILSKDAIEANPYLSGMTAGQWRRSYGARLDRLTDKGGGRGMYDVGGAAAGGGGGGANFSIAPLRVVHETPDGQQTKVEHLLVSPVDSPQPWGGH